jgi:SAM-dependent methyltransferase
MLGEQAPPIEHNATHMNLRFLVYLAGVGATNIHPLGRSATGALIAQLDLRPGQRVLEVGCGTGGTMLRVARKKPARIDGVDVIPAMLLVARRRLRLLGLGKRSTLHLVKPGERLPFPDASYDRVYTESVLGFQDEAGTLALLGEIFRVLRPGGKYVANEAIWRAGVSAELIAEVNEACLADFGLRMASAAPWALPEWLRIMQAAGFEVISADLIDEHLRLGKVEGNGMEVYALLSTALTRFYWLRGLLTPAVRRARASYRRLMQRHRNDGLHIEPRLFVLQKPLASGALTPRPT